MPKVILTRGLPGSGKSTWAKDLVKHHPKKYLRVNKDTIREMLAIPFNGSKSEFLVEEARDKLIILGMERGLDVIVDDTNLSPRHFSHIFNLIKNSKQADAYTIEYAEFTSVPLEVCIERDRERPTPVGERVIRKMWRENLLPAQGTPAWLPYAPTAIICDIDGTLAIRNNRSPYDFTKCINDSVNIRILDILYKYPNTQKILCTGREEKYREVTEEWLRINMIFYSQLFMRPLDDASNDSVVKKEIYEDKIKGQYNVLFVLDDRNRVVDMWRQQGLVCLQVADGDF